MIFCHKRRAYPKWNRQCVPGIRLSTVQANHSYMVDRKTLTMTKAGKRYSLLMLLTIVALLAMLLQPALPVKADPGWVIETLDSGANIWAGSYSSIALDSSGNPHISYTYYSTTNLNGDLKYASYNGTAWNTETVASSGGLGPIYTTSLALDSSDRPHISFYENHDGAYKYASYNGTAWQIQTIESGYPASGSEMESSIAVDSSDNPHVSFISSTGIKYASYNGTAWNTEIVTSDCGWSNSLAIDGNVPHIAYNYGSGGFYLGYASYNGTAWNTTQVTTGANYYTGRYVSLAIDSNHYPHISHTYQTPHTFISDLDYAYQDASGWHNQTVDSADDVGLFTSLALDASDHPHISYFDNTHNYLKYAWYDGSTWNIETVDTQCSYGATSLALDICGYPYISYYHITGAGSSELKYAYFVPSPGLAVSKGGPSVSKVGDNITYWLNISNTGDVPLQKVSVTDTLIAGIDSMFSATLPVRASENRTYSYIVGGGDPNPLLNTVTAVYGGTCFSNLSVSDNHSVTLVHPSISVAKYGPPVSKVGDTIDYWAAITNTGDCTLVRDSVNDSLSGDIGNLFAGTLASGVTDNQTYTYVVQAGDPDPLPNTVTFHYHPEGLSNDITDNATCSVDLVHPYILISKAVAAGIYGVGDNITYRLSIANTSTDITLVKDSVTDSMAGDITGLFSDNITAGGSNNQTYTYIVKATDPDPLVNDVTVHYHPQGLPNDISDNSSATVFLTPTINSVTPNQGNQGQTLDIVMIGSQLNRVNAIDLGTGITVNSFTVDSATRISATISIDTGAALGTRDVTATNPSGSDTLIGGFTVQLSQTTLPSVLAQPRSSPSIYTSQGMPGQSQIQLQYLSINPRQTIAGQPVTITTNVANTGGEAGSYNVVLKINGQVEETRMVTVGRYATQPVKFTTAKVQPGTYTVNIGDQKSTFIVTGADGGPGSAPARGIFLAAVMAVIALLVMLLVIVARRRSQGY
jgi:uncharacterized repeat protein (TIGR01451 family)